MAVTNGYTDVTTLKDYLGLTVSTYDALQLPAAINSSSRAIDGYCGRRFWQDGSLITRLYDADSQLSCPVDDISTRTGLVVSVDLTGYGNYDITLTETSHFQLHPLNAEFEYPVRPWDELVIVLGSIAYFPPPRQRPGVKVTAKFGWPAVPDDVSQACLIKAARIFHRKDSPQGVAGFGEFGPVRLSRGEDGDVMSLLANYQKAAMG